MSDYTFRRCGQGWGVYRGDTRVRLLQTQASAERVIGQLEAADAAKAPTPAKPAPEPEAKPRAKRARKAKPKADDAA